MTLVETLVALALLGVGILMAGSVVLWASRVEERAGRRVAALEVAGNVAEQVRAGSYAAVRSGELDLGGEPPPPVLEDATVALEVVEDEEQGLKTVRVVVKWAGKEPGQFILVTAVGRGPYAEVRSACRHHFPRQPLSDLQRVRVDVDERQLTFPSLPEHIGHQPLREYGATRPDQDHVFSHDVSIM